MATMQLWLVVSIVEIVALVHSVDTPLGRVGERQPSSCEWLDYAVQVGDSATRHLNENTRSRLDMPSSRLR
jgi:hypothetical protein